MSVISEILEGSGLTYFASGYTEEVEVIASTLDRAFLSGKEEVRRDFLRDTLTCSSTTLALARAFAENPSAFAIPEKGYEVRLGDLILAVLTTDTFGMCLQAEYPVADVDLLLGSGLLDKLAEYFMPFHGDMMKIVYYSHVHLRRFLRMFRTQIPQPEQAKTLATELYNDLHSKVQQYEFMTAIAKNVALLRSLQLLTWGYTSLALIDRTSVFTHKENHKVTLRQMVESIKAVEG